MFDCLKAASDALKNLSIRLTYIGLNSPLVLLENDKQLYEYEELGIKFKDVLFKETVNSYFTREEALYLENKYEEAFDWYTKAADKGNVLAQYKLGEMYYNGEGVIHDYAKAVEWYEKAAEQGNLDAQLRLVDMYYNGEGVEKDYTKSVKWFRKADEQEDLIALYNLECMYYNGRNLEKDYVKAIKLYKKLLIKELRFFNIILEVML